MSITTFKLPRNISITVGKTQGGAFYDDTLEYLCNRQRGFSLATFGPDQSAEGVLKHIEKELVEVRADPSDPSEWADIILLALDGAMRSGIEPECVAEAVFNKLKVNEKRDWPPVSEQNHDQPVEHVMESK